MGHVSVGENVTCFQEKTHRHPIQRRLFRATNVQRSGFAKRLVRKKRPFQCTFIDFLFMLRVHTHAQIVSANKLYCRCVRPIRLLFVCCRRHVDRERDRICIHFCVALQQRLAVLSGDNRWTLTAFICHSP